MGLSGNFLGLLLITASVVLLVHSFIIVNDNKEAREDTTGGGVSVAISQFDLANGGIESLVSSTAKAALSASSTSTTGMGRVAKFMLFGEIGAALLFGVIGIAMVTGSALRTAQRVEVNATAPYASFDSCVYSGPDFCHTNHRGRRVGRVDMAR